MKHALVLLVCLQTILGTMRGQGVFEMSNDSVSVCEGQLQDSNDGTVFGNYDHNENYTFTICIPEADANITMTFLSFCTEEDFDSLRVFDGPDTLSPQIGPAYHGTNSPGTIISTTNCLTIHFVSDANITCSGWIAEWSTEVTVPKIPPIGLDDLSPPCSTQTLLVNFANKINCTDLLSGIFSINGPISQTITNITPINCSEDSTLAVQLDFSPGLIESGTYVISFVNSFFDVCETPWLLSAEDSLFIDDCPIQVEISAGNSTLCPLECTDISTTVGGGNLGPYHYAWNYGLPDSAGPFQICPDSSMLLIVKVSDSSNSPIGVDSILITLRTNPKIFTDSSFCQSDTGLLLQAVPSGGVWEGSGVSDPSSGWFEPETAIPGINTLIYTDPYGCVDSTEVNIREINAGDNQASCPDGPPFMLDDFAPSGGLWSGPFVSDSGLFTPPSHIDSLTLSYTVNGCTDIKSVLIAQILLKDTVDTLCESNLQVQLSFEPEGGEWTGPGIINPTLGIFSPTQSGPGVKTLYYNLNGCRDSISFEVIALSIGGNLSLCPQNDPIWLGVVNPPGGIWSGVGIVNPDSGIYDPSFVTDLNYIDTITYTYGGCADSRYVYVRETSIQKDSLVFCKDHEVVGLGQNVTLNHPFDGSWSGPGVISPSLPGQFDPGLAGVGSHELIYEANGCSDTLLVLVREGAGLRDTAICEFSDPISLATEQPGGIWTGPGIVDSSGIFDPEVVGIGTYTIHYQTPQGCFDSTEVGVFQPPIPTILDLAGIFCYQDTVVPLQGYPGGGYFFGPGIVNDSLHVLAADSGLHPVTYFYGDGACMTFWTDYIEISPPLQVSITSSDDIICHNSFATLVAQSEGGIGYNYSYLWSHSLSREDTIGVTPDETQSYQVIASDGCSIKDSADITIAVKDDFYVSMESSDPVCTGEEGYLLPYIEPQGLYAVEWQGGNRINGDTLFGKAFFRYRARIIDVLQGCEKEIESEIPSHDFVFASFSPNPNQECVTTSDPTFIFLNKAEGANHGIWDFGDGTTEPFILNKNPQHTYPPESQSYRVHLYLDNGFGCRDTASAEVCVEAEDWKVYIPNVFSPNNDLVNDYLEISAEGVKEYHLIIMNRAGQKVFESFTPADSWDGNFKGSIALEGVYMYRLTAIIESSDPTENLSPFERFGTITLIR